MWHYVMPIPTVIISVFVQLLIHRGLLQNKAHPRELDPRDMRFRGRIRVHLKNDDGSPVKEQFPTRKQFTCAIINVPHHSILITPKIQ